MQCTQLKVNGVTMSGSPASMSFLENAGFPQLGQGIRFATNTLMKSNTKPTPHIAANGNVEKFNCEPKIALSIKSVKKHTIANRLTANTSLTSLVRTT